MLLAFHFITKNFRLQCISLVRQPSWFWLKDFSNPVWNLLFIWVSDIFRLEKIDWFEMKWHRPMTLAHCSNFIKSHRTHGGDCYSVFIQGVTQLPWFSLHPNVGKFSLTYTPDLKPEKAVLLQIANDSRISTSFVSQFEIHAYSCILYKYLII